MKWLCPVLFLMCTGTSAQFVPKGVHDGIEITYRWKHPTGKPSEMLVKLVNTNTEDKRLDLVIDLYYQGRTVEVLQADTCIRSGQTLNGKLNGLYFVPTKVSAEQIRSGDVEAEITRSTVEPSSCP